MTEQNPASLSPDELLAIKDNVTSQWDRLPAEHQASMALTLVSKISGVEYGGWLLASMALLNPQGNLSVDVSNEQLKQTGLTEEELSQLTEADHQNIRQRIINHWLQDGIWEELNYQARQVLREKISDSHNQ